MKALLLQSELGVLRGGGENFSRNLFAAFLELGHQVTAAFITDSRGKYPLALPHGMIPLPVRTSRSIDSLGAAVSRIGHFVARGPQVKPHWDRIQENVNWRTFRRRQQRFNRALLRQLHSRWNDFDVVYVHSDVVLASQVAPLHPTVLRLTGPVSDDLKQTLIALPVVCANGDALARLRVTLGDRANEIPIGLDDRLFCPQPSSVRAKLGWTEQHIVVGYVGRLFHLKGVDLLATAFQKLSRVRPEARLLFVGGGDEENTIRSTLAKEIAGKLVHIEPGIDHEDLPSWYNAMDLFAMPSRYENFSNAILEAMACCVPFLSSDTGGNRLLANTGAGWLFETNSDASLADRLITILDDRPEMRVRGDIARRAVQGRYSWKVSAECLEKIISTRFGIKG